ncbi:MAG: purine-nucleoside phosphorylase [Desulfobacterales bacterium]|jgi:purine-nucleoside phosphorylase
MKTVRQRLAETIDFIKSRIKEAPYIGLLTGTGLGDSAESMAIETTIRYADIPHFPISTVQTHIGRLLSGTINACPVIAMQGRFHLYEGYRPVEVTFPIRVMQQLGVKILILSNAAGGLNPDFNPGDIMLITDHINLTGTNPLIGPNEDSWGPRFPDMTRAYDEALIAAAESIANESGVKLQKGIYVGLTGPSLETPSEVKFLQTIGAEAVGFSTVHEVIAAVHSGMRVLGLSTITNVHNPENPVPATVEEIIEVAKGTTPLLETIMKGVSRKIYETEIR